MTSPTVARANAVVPAPRALVDYEMPSLLTAPPRQRLLLWLLLVLVGVIAAALTFGRVDIVVSAGGRIVTGDSEIVLQPLETAVVRTLPVRVGQRLKAGDIVATLDPTFTEADIDELDAHQRNLQATVDRLQAEIGGADYDPPNANPDEATQREIFRRRRDEYAARLEAADRKVQQLQADLDAHRVEAAGLDNQIALAGQAQSMYQQLVATNLASKLKLIETSRDLIDAQSRRDTNAGEQKKLVEEIAAAQADRDAFIQEWRRKLAEDLAQTRSERDAAEARLTKARLRHQLVVLRAPRDAIVLYIADRPPGAVVREAEPLVRLVPSDTPLLAEVRIDTRDVARLHIGDRATIKFEALPWQRFGLAHGTLDMLTPDTVEDRGSQQTAEDTNPADTGSRERQSSIHYRARIRLTDNQFRNLPKDFTLRPGMRLVADVKIGRRSLLQYVVNPISRVIRDSFREP